MSTGPEPDNQKEALATLEKAVIAFDVNRALEALYASKVLDGLDARLRVRFPDVRNDLDYYHVIATAVDALATELENRRRITSSVGFVWRVAERAASAELRRRRHECPTDPQLMAGKLLPLLPTDPAPAIQEARRLLPRIRGENVRNVLALILDSMAQGRQVLSSKEIAETLGISEVNARQLRVRAFDRLTLLAREEQAAGRGFNLPELDDDEGELLVAPDGCEEDDED